MRKIKASIFGVSIGIIIFYLVSSGCTWITFTAKDRLTDKIVLDSTVAIKSIYLKFPKSTKKKAEQIDEFKNCLENDLKKMDIG